MCKRDPSHVETAVATVTSEETKAPTSTEKGEMTHTATFPVDWATTQTRTEEIPPTGDDPSPDDPTASDEPGRGAPSETVAANAAQACNLAKTGDTGHAGLWALLASASLIGMTILTAVGRRRRGQDRAD